MLSEKFKLLVGKVKTKLSDIKPEDIANFAIKEAAGSIPVVGQYIKDAIDEFEPDEKLELLLELKQISQNQFNQFTEISKEIGVSVEFLQDIKTFTYDACAIQKADHEEIKQLLLRLIQNQTKFEIPITNKPVTIPTIQSVLRKNEIIEGEFFRIEPAWVDFEQGFIVERKEIINDIMKRLESNDIQLVLGAPASGKSIILKNVGYKLANDNKKNVYFVELKRHSIDEIKLIFETITKMQDDNQIFIIDDAHLNLFDCERLAGELKNKGKRNLIIGSRESREITEEDPKDGAEYEILSELSKTSIHIKAEDVTERMIETFLEKQYHIVLNREEGFLHEYKKDLWLLSWALKAYNPKMNSVESDVIYKKITKSIEKIRVGKEKDPINAQDAFLPLAIFFRYEIPIERFFMEKQLQIDGKTIINKLIEIQEIVETDESGHNMLSLHHSSIAELYFGAYLRKSDLGRKIKENILEGKDEEHLEYCSFFRYLTTSLRVNTIDVFLKLGRDFSIEKGGLTLLRKLVEHNEIKKIIETGINKQGDIEKIGGCIRGIAGVNEQISFELINNIDIDVLSAKIEKEKDIQKIGKCVRSVAAVNETRAMELTESISVRIENEEDLLKVGKCVADISWTNKYVAAKLANSISSRIEKEKEIKKVLRLISVIAKTNEQLLSNLVESISVRLKSENDIEKIREFIAEFKVNSDLQIEFVNNIDINSISEKIKNGADIGKLGELILDIESINEEVSFNLTENIDNDILASAINKEPSIAKISKCVSSIARVNKNKALKLADLIDIDGLSWKIKIKKNIEDIGKLISTIAAANKDVGMKLSENIDIDILLSKIEIEKDIEKVLKCVKDIANVNELVGLGLIVGVSSRSHKEEDLGKIGDWVEDFSKYRNMELLRWVDSVSSRLDEEKDVGKIGGYIFIISRMGIYSDNILKINDFSAKIKDEKDVEKTGRLIFAIAGMNEGSAKELVNLIDIDSLSTKIEKEVDTEKISLCVRNIARLNEEVGLKLALSVSANLDKESDLEKIGMCVSGIARVNEVVGLKLIESVSAKLDKEKDIKKITACVSDIVKANEVVGMKLVELVSVKLEQENDIEMIGMCVSGIILANAEVGTELVKNIDPQSILSKMKRNKYYSDSDKKKIGKLILSLDGAKNSYLARHILNNLNNLTPELKNEVEIMEPMVSHVNDVF